MPYSGKRGPRLNGGGIGVAGAESFADGGGIVVVSGRWNDSRHGHDDAAHGPP
jgi:hypothetical protein